MGVLSGILRKAGRRMYQLAYKADKKEIYEESLDSTYAVGETLFYDIMQFVPDRVIRIYIRKGIKEEILESEAFDKARKLGIPVEFVKNLRPSNYGRVSYISVELRKQKDVIQPGSHVVLVEPDIPRNVGAIMRTALGFGIHDIAVIGKEMDLYSPWLIRSSMGARLRVRTECIPTIEDYMERFPGNAYYAFMLDGAKRLGDIKAQTPFSLIFGNETNGLPEEYAKLCQPVFIEQGSEINSLNIEVAVAVAAYVLTGRGKVTG